MISSFLNDFVKIYLLWIFALFVVLGITQVVVVRSSPGVYLVLLLYFEIISMELMDKVLVIIIYSHS